MEVRRLWATSFSSVLLKMLRREGRVLLTGILHSVLELKMMVLLLLLLLLLLRAWRLARSLLGRLLMMLLMMLVRKHRILLLLLRFLCRGWLLLLPHWGLF